jgi:hypothetical protein
MRSSARPVSCRPKPDCRALSRSSLTTRRKPTPYEPSSGEWTALARPKSR